MERILAAVDGSAGSMRAVEFAADLAAKFQAELVLVSVVGHEPVPDFALMDVQRDQVRGAGGEGAGPAHAAEAQARDALAKARKAAAARGASSIRTDIVFGDAAQEILKLQQQAGAEMIVVGSRGRGRLAGLVLGSISQKVASLATCSVVIAR